MSFGGHTSVYKQQIPKLDNQLRQYYLIPYTYISTPVFLIGINKKTFSKQKAISHSWPLTNGIVPTLFSNQFKYDFQWQSTKNVMKTFF
jgi:hypothetical protein